MVVFGRKWLYSGKISCIRAKLLYSGRRGCIWIKVVILLQSGFIRAKWMYSGKSSCIRAKEVVFGQNLLYLGKVDVLGQ